MKTSKVISLFKASLAIALFAMGFAKAAAQIDPSSRSGRLVDPSTVRCSIPCSFCDGGGEEF